MVHVGRRAGDQVVQRVRRELLLDREHGKITGDLQRGHQRRLLDRQASHPGQALRPAHREHEPVPHVTGADDRGRPVRPGLVAGVHARDQPGGVHQAAGVAEVAGRGAGPGGGGQRVAGRVADDHVRTGQDLGQLV